MISIMGKVHMQFAPVQKCHSRGAMSELFRDVSGTCSVCVLPLVHKHELRREKAKGALHRGEKLCVGGYCDSIKDA